MSRKRLGLIVNPVAGIGGSVGLKGSDGVAVQARARQLGGASQAQVRAAQTLAVLTPLAAEIDLLTCPGSMGEDVARAHGFAPIVVGAIPAAATTAEETRQAARAMQQAGVDLLLFAGGDGTARDICSVVGLETPVLGIPAGVKIHSAVFAITPRRAGEVATAFLGGRVTRLHDAEVVDLDEEAYRAGVVSTRLYGFLRVPDEPRLVQNRKAPTPASEAAQMEAIAAEVVEAMDPGCLYILGPGTTTRAIAARLGIGKTLLGVDVVERMEVGGRTREVGGRLVASDVGEAQLLETIGERQAKIVVTPIGGQGFLFGRGNQQIGPEVLRRVGRANVIVVSTPQKLYARQGQPLLVDTGDPALDAQLAGYVSVITGYRERVVYRVAE